MNNQTTVPPAPIVFIFGATSTQTSEDQECRCNCHGPQAFMFAAHPSPCCETCVCGRHIKLECLTAHQAVCDAYRAKAGMPVQQVMVSIMARVRQ